MPPRKRSRAERDASSSSAAPRIVLRGFVLRGQVIFHLSEKAISAGGGDFVMVPSETIHDLENPGPERLYLLTVLSRDEGFADLLQHGIPTPLDAEDLAVLRTL